MPPRMHLEGEGGGLGEDAVPLAGGATAGLGFVHTGGVSSSREKGC